MLIDIKMSMRKKNVSTYSGCTGAKGAGASLRDKKRSERVSGIRAEERRLNKIKSHWQSIRPVVERHAAVEVESDFLYFSEGILGMGTECPRA
jgi:hypothetical protein